MEKLKDNMIAICISVFSGIIVWILQMYFSLTWVLVGKIIFFSVVFAAFFYFLRMYIKIRSFGITNILDSQIKGEGGTKACMEKAGQEICFIGIGALKWIEEKETFEDTIRRICGHQCGKIRFLLLNPDSDAARTLDVSMNKRGEKKVSEKIRRSLENINEVVMKLNKEAGSLDYTSNFQIRLYNQIPIYRLILLDYSCAYFSFYRLGSDGSRIRQFVVRPIKKASKKFSNNIYEVLKEYFETLWKSNDTVPYKFMADRQDKPE